MEDRNGALSVTSGVASSTMTPSSSMSFFCYNCNCQVQVKSDDIENRNRIDESEVEVLDSELELVCCTCGGNFVEIVEDESDSPEAFLRQGSAEASASTNPENINAQQNPENTIASLIEGIANGIRGEGNSQFSRVINSFLNSGSRVSTTAIVCIFSL